ncbi:MAG: prolyl oligopeptidase family serine peptidase [Promethearchaeota archaeon]
MASQGKEFPLESLLSARRLLSPQMVNDRVYFISDLSGMYSLYVMDRQGSFPEPLLPRGLALQNPHLMSGYNFRVIPSLGKILVMVDKDGDENYQPCFIPITGGVPKLVFGDKYAGQQLSCLIYDNKTTMAYFSIDDRKTPDIETIQVHLSSMKVTSLGKSIYGNFPIGHSPKHDIVLLSDLYTANDDVLYLWKKGNKGRSLLYGTPLDKREKGKEYPLLGLGLCSFIRKNKGIIFRTTLHDDKGGIGFLDLSEPSTIHPVKISGIKHKGFGELNWLRPIHNNTYLIHYNIDGCSWIYPAELDEASKHPQFTLHDPLLGKTPVRDGVQLGIEASVNEKLKPVKIEYVIAFTTATSPSQLYLIDPANKSKRYTQLSHERILGIDQKYLSPGEDASFKSFDGLDISARLYLPSSDLGYKEPYPLILYVHGGPQGQERPDFTWFSMPLIQYFTLNGFAVFVPNVRGSTGYGQAFMKMVDRDWGGNDAKDHIEGLKHLEKDQRIDSHQRAVVGRSYGGYMTLWLSANYPEYWKASCDMFGPYNLFTFLERLPETWQTYFHQSLGHPEKDKELLTERSPATHFHKVKAPMLIIQGANDPRVVEAESADVAEQLRKQGVEVEFLVFKDEGHGFGKTVNLITAYKSIVAFFKKHLMS